MESGLSAFQIRVARVFFSSDESAGYVVAGGAALLASSLISRTTRDLDLFASSPTVSVVPAKESLLGALARREWTSDVVHESETFCRVVVRGDGEEVLVDLALDSPPHEPATMTVLGPTLAPLELAGRKLLALFGRAEARDFADVRALAQRFGKAVLVAEATEADPGFDVGVLAQMMATLDRFDDDEIPVPAVEILAMRAYFAAWSDELR